METLELTHDDPRELLFFRGGDVQLLDQFQQLLHLGVLMALGLLRPLWLVLLHGDQFLRRIGNASAKRRIGLISRHLRMDARFGI